MARLYAATGDAVARLDENATASGGRDLPAGSGAQCLASIPPTRHRLRGAWRGRRRRTTDGGRTWIDCGLARAGRLLASRSARRTARSTRAPSRARSSAATTGARRGDELDALLELPSRPTWSFPPRPWTSHVRWIAPSPHDAGLLLVGIELGGLMRSTDGGETLARPPARRAARRPLARVAPARARAGLRGGRRRRSLERRRRAIPGTPADDGRDRHYTWSVAVDPDDPGAAGTSPRAPARSRHTAGATRRRSIYRPP